MIRVSVPGEKPAAKRVGGALTLPLLFFNPKRTEREMLIKGHVHLLFKLYCPPNPRTDFVRCCCIRKSCG